MFDEDRHVAANTAPPINAAAPAVAATVVVAPPFVVSLLDSLAEAIALGVLILLMVVEVEFATGVVVGVVLELLGVVLVLPAGVCLDEGGRALLGNLPVADPEVLATGVVLLLVDLLVVAGVVLRAVGVVAVVLLFATLELLGVVVVLAVELKPTGLGVVLDDWVVGVRLAAAAVVAVVGVLVVAVGFEAVTPLELVVVTRLAVRVALLRAIEADVGVAW